MSTYHNTQVPGEIAAVFIEANNIGIGIDEKCKYQKAWEEEINWMSLFFSLNVHNFFWR